MLYIAIAAVLLLLFFRIVPAEPHIVDGDTIAFANRHWRMAGYDAPEFDQPGGRQASAHVRDELARGWSIGIAGGTDVYGRRMIRILTRRGPLATRMMLAGWGHAASPLGWPFTLYARIRRRGVWKSRDRVVSPRAWREMNPRGGRMQKRRSRPLRLKFSYGRQGLKLPGGFIIP